MVLIPLIFLGGGAVVLMTFMVGLASSQIYLGLEHRALRKGD